MRTLSNSSLSTGSGSLGGDSLIAMETSVPCSNDPNRVRRQFARYIFKNMHSCFCTKSDSIVTEDHFSKAFSLFCEINRIVENRQLSPKKKFRLIDRPTMSSINQFLDKYIDYLSADHEIVIYALFLLQRFLESSKWTLRASIWRPLVITSFLLAMKIEEKAIPSLSAISYIYALYTPREFSRMEMFFLKIVDYRVMISREDFLRMLPL